MFDFTQSNDLAVSFKGLSYNGIQDMLKSILSFLILWYQQENGKKFTDFADAEIKLNLT